MISSTPIVRLRTAPPTGWSGSSGRGCANRATMAAMRSLVLVALAAACGTVNNKPDAGGDDGGGDDGPAPLMPGEYRWVRSLSSMQGYGVADGPGGIVVSGAITA